MEINILEQNNEKIVSIKGRMDTITASDLEMKICQIWSEPNITVVFDCAEMEYISSSGLRIILSTQKHVTAAGGKFILRNVKSEVYSVIELTGFSRILTIE